LLHKDLGDGSAAIAIEAHISLYFVSSPFAELNRTRVKPI